MNLFRVDAPRSKPKVIGPTAPSHGQPRPSHALHQLWSQAKASSPVAVCLRLPVTYWVPPPPQVCIWRVSGNVTWCAPCPVCMFADSNSMSTSRACGRERGWMYV